MRRGLVLGSVLWLVLGLLLLAPRSEAGGPGIPTLRLLVSDCSQHVLSNTSVYFSVYRNGALILPSVASSTDGGGYVTFQPNLVIKTDDICRVALVPGGYSSEYARDFVYRYWLPVDDYTWQPDDDPLDGACNEGANPCCTNGFWTGSDYYWHIRISQK